MGSFNTTSTAIHYKIRKANVVIYFSQATFVPDLQNNSLHQDYVSIFLPGIFSGVVGGEIYCYANLDCYSDLSFYWAKLLEGQKYFRGGQTAWGAHLPTPRRKKDMLAFRPSLRVALR